MLLRRLERHPGHDRLQEAEDDELAGLVGRDAARLEVEELSRVDGPDRRRVHRPAAVGLVDLERRDCHRASRLREVHPELAEEEIGPAGRLLDRDEALHVGAGPVEEGALREEVARRVAADVGRVAGRSKTCSADPNTISACSTELRSPSSRLSTRERTRREPSWASAQWSEAPSPIRAKRCWKTTWRGPRSWMAATASLASVARTTSMVPWKKPWGTVSPSAQSTSPDGDQLLDERGAGAFAEADERPRHERPAGIPTRPPDRIGWARRTRSGTTSRTPWLQKPRASWASLSSAGSVAPPSRSAREGHPDREPARPRRSRASRRPRVAAGDRARATTVVLAELDQAVDAVRQRPPASSRWRAPTPSGPRA